MISSSQFSTNRLNSLKIEAILHEWLEGSHATRIAIEHDATTLTFRQFAQRILARRDSIEDRLESKEVDRVAIIFDASPQSVIALWAAIFSHRRFSLGIVSPNLPSSKVENLFKQFSPQFYICEAVHEGQVPSQWRHLPGISLYRPSFDETMIETGPADVDSEVIDREIVLFTSGSSGAMKGVLHSLRTLLPAINNQSEAMGLEPGQSQLVCTPPAHIIGFLGVIRANLLQARLFLQPNQEMGATVDLIQKHQIEHLHTVPTWLRAFLREWSSCSETLPFKSLLLSGEAVFNNDFEICRPFIRTDCRFIVGLGSTEVPTYCFNRLPHFDTPPDATIPVGFPGRERQVEIVDSNQNPLPFGAEGALRITGKALWLGYWDSNSTVRSNGSKRPPLDAFLTSDIGTVDDRGCLRLIGRSDRTTKISGYRVTPIEVEIQIRSFPGVEDACCVFNFSSKRFRAAYTCKGNSTIPAPTELRAYLSENLEHYLLPEYLIQLESLPKGHSNKIDFNEVARIIDSHIERENYEDLKEEILSVARSIWTSLIKGATGRKGENFYHVGGDSVLAMRLVFELEKHFGLKLPLALVLQYPELGQLTRYIQTILPANGYLSLEVSKKEDLQNGSESIHAPGVSYPLSPNQQSIWFHHHRAENSPLYHMIADYEITGNVDPTALKESIRRLSANRDALRTCFIVKDGVPHQMVEDNARLDLQFLDWRGRSTSSRTEVIEYFTQIGRTPFDLGTAPLARAILIQTTEQQFCFMFVFHHLIIDGRSFAELYRELGEYYTALTSGNPPTLSARSPDFRYLENTKQYTEIEKASSNKALPFWKEHLHRAPRNLALPIESRQTEKPEGAHAWISFPAEIVVKLEELSSKLQATQFVILLASFKATWARITGVNDIVVGSPFSGRTDPKFLDAIGFFVNTLPLRSKLEPDLSFRALIDRLKSDSTRILEIQEYPGTRISEHLETDLPDHNGSLFNLLFGLQPDRRGLQLGATHAERMGVSTATAKFDLSVLIFPHGDVYEVLCEYRSDILNPSHVSMFLDCWQTLLTHVLESPETKLHDLPYLPASVNNQLIHWSGRLAARVSNPQTVPDLVEKWVRLTPDQIAVEDGNNFKWSYSELWQESQRISDALIEHGVNHGARVGIYTKRSGKTAAIMLGILRAGASYVFINPDRPFEFYHREINSASVRFLIVDEFTDISSPLKDIKIMPVSGLREGNASTPLPDINGSMEACIFFTSGTTGVPKGARIPHRAVSRLVNEPQFATFNASTISLQMAPLEFDASTIEIWGPLANGGKVVFAPPQQQAIGEIGEFIRSKRINTLWLTSGLFNLVADLENSWLEGVSVLMAGGDVLSPEKVGSILRKHPHLELVNGYGPTENTTFSCCHRIELSDLERTGIPIGKPIKGTEAFILNENGELVPPGYIGEIAVGGEGMFLGYIGDSETPPDWSITGPGGIPLYRTGDYGFWNDDGAIHFVGRRDRQAKVRGFRVELDAIEHVIGSISGVNGVAITCSKDAEHSYLVCHYTSDPITFPGESSLIRSAKSSLSDFMVPARWIHHKEMPLTKNGKINRKALATIKAFDDIRHESNSGIVDAHEVMVANIWRNLLGLRRVGPDDDFFEIGGNSLLALKALLELETHFQVPVPLQQLFRERTPRRLARSIIKQNPPPTGEHIVPLRSGGSGPPIYFIHGWAGCLFHFIPLAKEIPKNIPVMGIQANPGFAHGRDFESIATHYVDEILKATPSGPYILAGYSLGGLLAREVARQMKERGIDVDMIYLFDTSPWNVPPAFQYMMELKPLLHLIGERFSNHIKRILEIKPSPIALIRYCRERVQGIKNTVSGPVRYRTAARNLNKLPKGQSTPELLKAKDPFTESMKRHIPKPYHGNATLILAETSKDSIKIGWRYLIRGKIHVARVPGDHYSFISQETKALAKILTDGYLNIQKETSK